MEIDIVKWPDRNDSTIVVVTTAEKARKLIQDGWEEL